MEPEGSLSYSQRPFVQRICQIVEDIMDLVDSKGFWRWYITELLGFGLCPSSGILKTREHNVSETGSVSEQMFSPFTWGRKQTQFPKRCVL
jgi:hypothetical protein